MKQSILPLLISLLCGSQLAAQSAKENEVRLSGNAYVTAFKEGAQIGRDGLEKWTDPKSRVETYVYFSKPQTVEITLNGHLPEGRSRVSVWIEHEKNKSKKLSKKQRVTLKEGAFNVKLKPLQIHEAGYVSISLQGESKSGEEFGRIVSMTIKSDDDNLVYVHDFEEYWGRRGPSVHLTYTMPEEPVEWFYNEVTVPVGNDVIGSYYMANGFGEGYFGIQCNSDDERRVLFSVWSPFDTQDPKLIPDSMKVVLLDKGEGVYTGEFGNEGSGGQSFLRFPWKAGNTYRFLTQVIPDEKGNTKYTAWFFAPEESKWRLIASFLRPKTSTHYQRAHSFLENFYTEQGHLTRKVYFGNQWFRTLSGQWVPATEAVFTYDATANAGVRIDYQGGYHPDVNLFYLQNCGFFSDSTPYRAKFHRTANEQPPVIDLLED